MKASELGSTRVRTQVPGSEASNDQLEYGSGQQENPSGPVQEQAGAGQEPGPSHRASQRGHQGSQ